MEHSFRILPPRLTWDEVRPPFLCIRLADDVFSLQQLPTDLSREMLVTLGWSTIDAFGRQYQVCVVFGWLDAAFLELDGSVHWSPSVPSGGILVDPDPEILAFLPISVDPGTERKNASVAWDDGWDWAAVLKEQTEAMQAAWKVKH